MAEGGARDASGDARVTHPIPTAVDATYPEPQPARAHFKSGRMPSTPFWIATPKSPATSTAAGIAASTGQPSSPTSVRKQKYDANIAMPPCAKFTTPDPR